MNISNAKRALLEAHKKGYFVSDDGQLFYNGNAVRGFVNPSGYLVFGVRLLIDGKKKKVTVMVHRLRAYQTYGDSLFADGIVCRHLNSIKLDNSKANIAIGTHKENCMDKPEEDRLRYSVNAASKLRRFSDEVLSQIKSDHEAGMSYNKLKEKYGVCKGTLSYMFNEARYNGLIPKPPKVKVAL